MPLQYQLPIIPRKDNAMLTLDRQSAGISVAVSESGLLEVEVNGVKESVEVAREKLLDAYHHPMLYLSREQVQNLMERKGS